MARNIYVTKLMLFLKTCLVRYIHVAVTARVCCKRFLVNSETFHFEWQHVNLTYYNIKLNCFILNEISHDNLQSIVKARPKMVILNCLEMTLVYKSKHEVFVKNIA